MTKFMVWICDRCGTTVEVPQQIVVDDGYAFRLPRLEWTDGGLRGQGWEQFQGDGSVVDVCPSCVTAGEQVDRLLREVEAESLFGPPETG